MAQEPSATALVTGATGFLGGSIARALLAGGRRVRVLHRPGRESALRELAAAGAVPVAGDVTDRAQLERAMEGCALVFHAAALVSRGGRRQDFDRVNVGGLENVLDAARLNGVERVVYTSSFFALGPSDAARGASGPLAGIDEAALRPGAAELDHYQASKHRAALVALEAARGGAPVVLLLPGVLVGPGPLGESNFVTTMVRDHLAGKTVALPHGGRLRWSLVHVDDVARAHVVASERGRLGEAYVLGGENRSLTEVFAIVSRLTGVPPPTLSAPRALLWTLGLAEEAMQLVGRRPRLVTRGVARVLGREWALCSDKARRELGFEPRPLEVVLRATLAWLESQREIPAGSLRGDASKGVA